MKLTHRIHFSETMETGLTSPCRADSFPEHQGATDKYIKQILYRYIYYDNFSKSKVEEQYFK